MLCGSQKPKPNNHFTGLKWDRIIFFDTDDWIQPDSSTLCRGVGVWSPIPSISLPRREIAPKSFFPPSKMKFASRHLQSAPIPPSVTDPLFIPSYITYFQRCLLYLCRIKTKPNPIVLFAPPKPWTCEGSSPSWVWWHPSHWFAKRRSSGDSVMSSLIPPSLAWYGFSICFSATYTICFTTLIYSPKNSYLYICLLKVFIEFTIIFNLILIKGVSFGLINQDSIFINLFKIDEQKTQSFILHWL